MDVSAPSSVTATARVASDATGYGLRFLGKHGWRMVLWFVVLLLPLWGFASLGGELHKKAVFPFDGPMLNGLHALATPVQLAPKVVRPKSRTVSATRRPGWSISRSSGGCA